MRWLTITLVVASLAAVGLGFTVAFRQGAGLDLVTGSAPGSEDPVLLVVVGHPENVDAVRRGLRGEPLLYDSREAFALEGGRIVVAHIAAASEALNELGWANRPLEIVDPSSWHGARDRADGGAALPERTTKPTADNDLKQALRVLLY